MKRVVLRFLWSRPKLYKVVQKLRRREDPLLDPNYDLLFDGFPRSGNTFGSFMIDVSQQNSLKLVAHHHTPRIFIWAAQGDKPACLTIRRPIDAITSWVVYSNHPIHAAIKYYHNFY